MDSSVWTALSESSVGPVWWQLETSLGRGLSPGAGTAEPHSSWGEGWTWGLGGPQGRGLVDPGEAR